MFCKNCGAAMPDDASFCPICGQNSKLPVNQPPPGGQIPGRNFAQEPYAAPYYQPQVPVRPNNRNKKLIIILAAAIVLVAAAIIILVVLVFGKTPDIEGTWNGRIAMEMSKDDSGLEDDFVDLLDRSSDAIIVFDMDDDGSGTAEIFFEEYPTEEIELDVKLKGKKFSLTGDILGNDTELSGKIAQKDETMTLAGDGIVKGSKGTMMVELDFDKESDKKIRPTTQETTYESTDPGDSPSETTNDGVIDTTPPVTETVLPTETSQAQTTQEVTDKIPTESLIDNTDLMDGYLWGDWVSGPYPDGTGSILVFYDDENVTWLIAYPEDSPDELMEGYKSGSWFTEYLSDGTYNIEGKQLNITWLDMDGFDEVYDIAIIDENTMDLTLYFDSEPYTDRYQRVIWE